MCHFSAGVKVHREVTQVLGVGVRLNDIDLPTTFLHYFCRVETFRDFQIRRCTLVQEGVCVTADYQIDLLDFPGDFLVGLVPGMTQGNENVDTLSLELFNLLPDGLYLVQEVHFLGGRQNLRLGCQVTDNTDLPTIHNENRAIQEFRVLQIRLLAEIQIRCYDGKRNVVYKRYQPIDAVIKLVVAQALNLLN